MYVNSPGGSIYSGLAIYDTMQFIKPEIQTICVGVAMSMGSLLLTGGAKGKRFSLPNSRILIHQPSAGFEGQSTDIEIHAREILNVRGRIDEIYAHHTGQPVEQVHTRHGARPLLQGRRSGRVRPDRPRDRTPLAEVEPMAMAERTATIERGTGDLAHGNGVTSRAPAARSAICPSPGRRGPSARTARPAPRS